MISKTKHPNLIETLKYIDYSSEQNKNTIYQEVLFWVQLKKLSIDIIFFITHLRLQGKLMAFIRKCKVDSV